MTLGLGLLLRSVRLRRWKHEHHQQQGGTRVQEQHAHAGAYIAGASRQHADEEIRAACLAIMPYVISQPSQQVDDEHSGYFG